MSQIKNFLFDIDKFMHEEDMMGEIEEKNWAVLVDGISIPGLSEEDAEDLAKRLRGENKKAVATEIFKEKELEKRTKIGRARRITVELSIRDESGLPLGMSERKLTATRYSDGWTVGSEKPQEDEKKGAGETRRQAVIDWLYKNR